MIFDISMIKLHKEGVKMKNTWYPHINTESLLSLKNEYLSLLSDRPYSAVVTRHFDDFRVSYVYNTNAIEGNPITHNDTAYIIKSGTFLETYSATHNMEVIGSNKAWDYVLALPEVSVKTILDIHKRVLFFDEENAGVFRKTPVYVGEKQMPDAERIAGDINALLEPDKSDIFKWVALFHLRFENLHPFIDGNGRTGRMLINLQLMLAGFLPINIKFNDVGRYYRSFRQHDISFEKGIQEMYNLITKYEHEELTGLMEAIKLNGHSHEECQ
jgi:Fic family protein